MITLNTAIKYLSFMYDIDKRILEVNIESDDIISSVEIFDIINYYTDCTKSKLIESFTQLDINGFSVAYSLDYNLSISDIKEIWEQRFTKVTTNVYEVNKLLYNIGVTKTNSVPISECGNETPIALKVYNNDKKLITFVEWDHILDYKS